MDIYKNQLFGIEYSELKEYFQLNYDSDIEYINYEVTDNKVSMPGICGEYCIPRFEIGLTSRKEYLTIFARRQLDSKESKQSHHYKYFESNGISVPKLYGSKIDSSNCEILLLEYAQEIKDETEFFSCENNISDFINLAAQVSSIKPSLNYLGLVGKDMGSKGDTRDWKTWMPWSIFILDKIWDLAVSNSLGSDLKKICSSYYTKEKLQKIAFSMITKIGSMEIGIAHSDFRPSNMVFIPGSKKLSLIDFEDIIIDAKYYDIARYLGAPEQVFKWDINRKDDYINEFINQCSLYNKNSLDFYKLKNDLFHIWFTRSINLWEWLPHEYGGPSYEFWPAGRDKFERCNNIYKLLNALISNIGKVEMNFT